MPFSEMMADLLAFCDKHQASITYLCNDDGRYHIELDYESKGHDGCKCKTLGACIPGFEDVDKQLDKLHLKKEEPDADGEVPCKKDELKKGDHVIYYGSDADIKGKECVVDSVFNHGYAVYVRPLDNVTATYKTSFTQLRRKVNGA